MDPAHGETGGKSLTSKLKARVHVKDKVKSLKNRIPGMKKRDAGGDDDSIDDNSEYDDGSPRDPGPETGYNVSGSTPFSTVKTTPVSHDSNSPPSYDRTSPREVYNRDYDSRPSQISPSGYDSQNRIYVAAAPPTRPAPMTTESPRSNLAPSLEEKFKYLDVGENPRVVNSPTDRSYQPVQEFSPSVTTPRVDPIRSYQPEQQFSPSVTTPQVDPIRSYQPEQQFSPSVTTPQVDPIRSYMPEQQYSPSTMESIQKGYSDVPRTSYRASPTAPANKGMVEKVRDSVAGAAVVLGDKMGYYNDTPSAPRDPNAPSILDKAKSTLGLDKRRDPYAPSVLDKAKSTLGLDKPADPNAPSILDKTKATLGLDKPRDPTAPSIVEKAKATLGMDKPRDPNAPPLTEMAKVYMNVAGQKTREYGATAADRAAWTRDRVAAQTTPTHHDKALSEQVTQTLNNHAVAIREKVFGPAPLSANTASSSNPPGIVDRVSGAVSWLFNVAPKETAERLQHTFPAHTDYHGRPAAASVSQPFAERSSVEERMPPTSTPAYPPAYAPTYPPAYAPTYPPTYPTVNS